MKKKLAKKNQCFYSIASLKYICFKDVNEILTFNQVAHDGQNTTTAPAYRLINYSYIRSYMSNSYHDLKFT